MFNSIFILLNFSNRVKFLWKEYMTKKEHCWSQVRMKKEQVVEIVNEELIHDEIQVMPALCMRMKEPSLETS